MLTANVQSKKTNVILNIKLMLFTYVFTGYHPECAVCSSPQSLSAATGGIVVPVTLQSTGPLRYMAYVKWILMKKWIRWWARRVCVDKISVQNDSRPVPLLKVCYVRCKIQVLDFRSVGYYLCYMSCFGQNAYHSYG